MLLKPISIAILVACINFGGCAHSTKVYSIKANASDNKILEAIEKEIVEIEESGCEVIDLSSTEGITVTASCAECEDVLTSQRAFYILAKCPTNSETK